MIVSKRALRLTFINQLGKPFSISFSDPKEDLIGSEIEDVMDQIIAQNIFTTSGGALVGKKDAKVIGTETEDLLD